MSEKVLFVKLSRNAILPTRSSEGAAGYDLHSAYNGIVLKRSTGLVQTDIKMQLPKGMYAHILPRSGLALKNQIDVGGGVIDSDYRGNVGIILFNHSNSDFVYEVGDRVAQMIFYKLPEIELNEVKALSVTDRGESGFGSTNLH